MSRSLSIVFLFSLISVIKIIDAKMIAKKVTNTINDEALISNIVGSTTIARVTPTNDIVIVNIFNRFAGKHSEARFKNPV